MPLDFLSKIKMAIKPKLVSSLDVITEWEAHLPDNISDIRKTLPRHSTKKWGKRELSNIQGLCIHQIAGGDKPRNTANYHVKHFNGGKGAPGLCYTFYIDRAGVIWWCNDIEDVTWSQGFAGRPGSENVDFLSIVCGGNFSGPSYTGKNEPTLEQMVSLLELIKWLCFHLELDYSDIFGHYDFGKRPCPGNTIEAIIEALNRDSSVDVDRWGDMAWQYNLVRLGYSLGTYGKNSDGCDGHWGNASKVALTLFQKSANIPVTGFQDKLSKKSIEYALRKKFGASVRIS